MAQVAVLAQKGGDLRGIERQACGEGGEKLG
jgi:hypothetical protein